MTFTTLISAQNLNDHLPQSQWVILDCRFTLGDAGAGAKAFRFGHIPKAHYVHLDKDLSSAVQDYTGRHPLPNFSLLAEKLGQWGVSNNTQVVVYDDAGGAFATRLWWLLRCMGHEQVAVLDGGIQQWQRLNLPLTTTLIKSNPTTFRVYLDTNQWLNACQIENKLARRSICLIDARASERFHGELEPIDPVAGHIPKAINRPYLHNLDASGKFLPAAELAYQLTKITAEFNSNEVVHMCGSGVTACHNLLAMEIAGLTGSKLYAGSWSEWITNKNRATERR